MAKRPGKQRPQGLPTRAQILDFLQSSPTPAGKRELAKAEAAFKEHQVDQHSGPLFEKEEEMEKGVNPLL